MLHLTAKKPPYISQTTQGTLYRFVMSHKLCVTFVCSLIHSSKQKAQKY